MQYTFQDENMVDTWSSKIEDGFYARHTRHQVYNKVEEVVQSSSCVREMKIVTLVSCLFHKKQYFIGTLDFK